MQDRTSAVDRSDDTADDRFQQPLVTFYNIAQWIVSVS